MSESTSFSVLTHPASHLLRIVAASGREILVAIAAPIQTELCALLDRGDLIAVDVYWRALLRCGETEKAQWSLPPLAALSICATLAASCSCSPSLQNHLVQCVRQCESVLALHCCSPAPPRLQIADLNKVVKGSQLSSRQVGFMPGVLLVFGGKGDVVRLYPSRCILSERIKTDDTVEIEYIEDDKPSTKLLLTLRAVTSAAASAVLAAIREVRHGCGGAASLFGESWNALVSASALHTIMDSPDSLAKMRSHFVSSRLFSKLDLDALAPAKAEGLLYVARGLAWRSLHLPMAATCDFTWGLTFSKRGDKSRVALQRERLTQLRRLCGSIMDAIQEDAAAAAAVSSSDNTDAARPAKGWAANWNASRELKLGVIAIALKWIKREGVDLKQAPPAVSRSSLSPGEKAVLSDDQISVASISTPRGAGVSDASPSAAPSSETASPSPLPTLFQTATKPSGNLRTSLGDVGKEEGSPCTTEQIVSFLTSSGVALSDFDLFEASDAAALAAQDRSRVESVRLTKYQEVRAWWEGQKDRCGGEMRLSGMKVQSLAGWAWEGSMNTVTSLYLDCNKLKEFSWDWVLLLPALTILSLESNRIERIGSFLSKDSCKSLNCLKFGGNNLAKLSLLTETIDPAVGSRVSSITLFGNPFLVSLRDESSGVGCDSITAEYYYVSSILASFPFVLSIDGFTLKEAHFWWVKMLSEMNSGIAALCQAMHPCQSTRKLALAPLLSWASAPVACTCFAALDGVSAVLPLLHYIEDPQAVFCGLMVIRRITSGTNSCSASGLCSSQHAPLFWALLNRVSEDFPDLSGKTLPQRSTSAGWTPAWTICVAALALEVLAEAVFPLHSSNRVVSSRVLISTFAQYANVPLPNVLTAIARIFGRGGSVFEPPSRRRNVSSREGADELDQAIAVIWGRSTSEEKWVKRLAGMQSLNDGFASYISTSAPTSPNAVRSTAAAASPATEVFAHSDALASSAYFSRLQRTSSAAASRRSSLLASQYSGSLMQSVSKHANAPEGDAYGKSNAGAGASSAPAAPDTWSQAHVRLNDCASLIYDCSVALLANIHDECKSVPAAVRFGAQKTILNSWRSDFHHSQLRQGFDRYGKEFAIMMELMDSQCSDGTSNVGVSGSDVVSIGYVAAACARYSLEFLARDGGSGNQHFLFTAACSTFFRALHVCDQSKESLDALKDAAKRNGLEMPISYSFIKSCFGGNEESCTSDDIKLEMLKHLNSCESAQGDSKIPHIFLEQVLGGADEGSPEVAALAAIASAVVDQSTRSPCVSLPHLTRWILRSLTRVSFYSIADVAGSSHSDAVAAISSLCRQALFDNTDVDTCARCLELLHHWTNPAPSTPPLQLVSFLGQPPPPLTSLCTLLQRTPPDRILSLSHFVTSFFANFYSVPEHSNRGLFLLIETLKTFSGHHHHSSRASSAQSSRELAVISAILQPSPPSPASVRLAGELCVRWDVKGCLASRETEIVLRRSADVLTAAAAAAEQAAACGNQRQFEDERDVECCSFMIYARHAVVGHIKLFQTVLEKFLAFSGKPTSMQLVMACLSSLFVLDSWCSPAAPGPACDSLSGSDSLSSESLSCMPRNKQFELVTDAIMALLRACRADTEDSEKADAAHDGSTLMIVRSIAAKLALKASRLDTTAMQKLLLNDTLVPFLSGLSSSNAGSGYGDGVDASTVAVINEICERALQSDVSAAIAAARAISALVEQCLSAGQTALASSVMSPLPVLLARLVYSPVSHPSLQRLTVACGTTFKFVLKVACHVGREITADLEYLWERTFECISVVLCLKPLLASPSLVFASSSAVLPAAATLLTSVLKEDFLPIAMSAVGLSRLIPWKLDDRSQAITSLLITSETGPAPPPIWWRRGMESVSSNFRENAIRLVLQRDCPPCVATASAVSLALLRLAHVDSLSPDAARIVAFLNSITLLIKAVLHSAQQDCVSTSSDTTRLCATDGKPDLDADCIAAMNEITNDLDKHCATAVLKVHSLDLSLAALQSEVKPASTTLIPPRPYSSDGDGSTLPAWIVEFVEVMSHVVAFFGSGGNTTSAFLLNFVARAGMPCISEFALALCQLECDRRINTAVAEQIQDALSSCCNLYTLMMSISSANSASASAQTLQLISVIWPHACNGQSKAQKSAISVLAAAVSKHGAAVVSDLAATADSLSSIVRLVVAHIESSRLQLTDECAACDARPAEAACQVLTACISVQPSLSVTVVPRDVLLQFCSFGWKWARSCPLPSLVETVSSMVAMPLRQVVSDLTSHIFGDVVHMENLSAWIKLVIRLLETNATYMCDIFMDDISALVAAEAADNQLSATDNHVNSSQIATRLLQYATICSLCGRFGHSDEVEIAFGFGMGLLFDNAWKTLPDSCHDLLFQRHYLHALFLSRHVMSKTTVSAAAFLEVLLCALAASDAGCAAALSLALLLCQCKDDADDADFKLDHMVLPDHFEEDFIRSLEMSLPSQSNSRSLQISLLFRIGMVLNWKAPIESRWKHRVINYYAQVLVLDCPLQHVLLQTISEMVLSPPETTPVSLSSALIFRTHHLSSDLLVPYGQSLLSQICSCLKCGFVTVALLRPLLMNLLSAINDDSCVDRTLTRTLIMALAAASSFVPSVLSAEISDITAICRSAQRHVMRSLGAAEACRVYDIETFQAIQLLCRLKVCDVLITEGLLAYFLRSFDAGIGVDVLQCISMSVSHAFAPDYADNSWTKCVPIVTQILLHSNFSGMLLQQDYVITLTELVTHALSIEYWLCRKAMPRIASLLVHALHYHAVNLLRDFYDSFLQCIPKLDICDLCEEFVVVVARCCGCNYTISDAAALRLSACRAIFAISELNLSVVAASVVVCQLIEAIEPCSASSESMVLLVRSMLLVAEASPLLLVDPFPSAILRVPLEVFDSLSAEVIHSVIQLMLSISFESSSVCMRFAESKFLGLLHFFMQKYAVRDDCTSASLCMLVSRLFLKVSVPPEMAEVSSAFSLLLSSWHAKLKQTCALESTVLPRSASLIGSSFHLTRFQIIPDTPDGEVCSGTQQLSLPLESKLSAIETGQGDLREALKSVATLSEVKLLFDSLIQNQQESLRQQQQETHLFREQMQMQMQMQQTLLQQQQHLLEQQQQQMVLQQKQLEQVALQQQSLMLPIRNQASAPPLSIEEDEFPISLPSENGSN